MFAAELLRVLHPGGAVQQQYDDFRILLAVHRSASASIHTFCTQNMLRRFFKPCFLMSYCHPLEHNRCHNRGHSHGHSHGLPAGTEHKGAGAWTVDAKEGKSWTKHSALFIFMRRTDYEFSPLFECSGRMIEQGCVRHFSGMNALARSLFLPDSTKPRFTTKRRLQNWPGQYDTLRASGTLCTNPRVLSSCPWQWEVWICPLARSPMRIVHDTALHHGEYRDEGS